MKDTMRESGAGEKERATEVKEKVIWQVKWKTEHERASESERGGSDSCSVSLRRRPKSSESS